jgi:hypothetical protein
MTSTFWDRSSWCRRYRQIERDRFFRWKQLATFQTWLKPFFKLKPFRTFPYKHRYSSEVFVLYLHDSSHSEHRGLDFFHFCILPVTAISCDLNFGQGLWTPLVCSHTFLRQVELARLLRKIIHCCPLLEPDEWLLQLSLILGLTKTVCTAKLHRHTRIFNNKIELERTSTPAIEIFETCIKQMSQKVFKWKNVCSGTRKSHTNQNRSRSSSFGTWDRTAVFLSECRSFFLLCQIRWLGYLRLQQTIDCCLHKSGQFWCVCMLQFILPLEKE